MARHPEHPEDPEVFSKGSKGSKDIVERLRDWPNCTPVTCKEAADEIERLRAKLADSPAPRSSAG
jgi:hypothetical protein